MQLLKVALGHNGRIEFANDIQFKNEILNFIKTLCTNFSMYTYEQITFTKNKYAFDLCNYAMIQICGKGKNTEVHIVFMQSKLHPAIKLCDSSFSFEKFIEVCNIKYGKVIWTSFLNHNDLINYSTKAAAELAGILQMKNPA